MGHVVDFVLWKEQNESDLLLLEIVEHFVEDFRSDVVTEFPKKICIKAYNKLISKANQNVQQICGLNYNATACGIVDESTKERPKLYQSFILLLLKL